ncbi:hypothetical protein OJ997_22890 [Solirubrobacter phytolaccae]|uniref:DUF6602 domain-containing protein n=1 Tax=Solirubrobacter phytolaccae TaxID=1404360 RepID=A0A9X3NAS3_9ACTN|nr:DUF6602 domain-containing protein [Solirubrobacter phytolaccae]MDA0183175.1 hypothetical protein [Solirubrobacter phytolaccae]
MLRERPPERYRRSGARNRIISLVAGIALTDHPLRVAMREMTAQLSSALAASAAIAHNASIGAARETVVRELLAPYLPARFQTATGTAVNKVGERSDQLDVMIVDGTAGRPFVNVGGQSVVPVELIYACLQIKTYLAPSTVAGAVENLASLLRLFPPGDEAGGAEERPFTAIVTYKATRDERELFEAFVEANLRLPPEEHVNCLLVLNKFVTVMSEREEDPANPHGNYHPVPRYAADHWSTASFGEDSTLAFYVLLSTELAGYRPPDFSPWTYVTTAELLPSGTLARYWGRYDDPDELAERRRSRHPRKRRKRRAD